jgi:hypothetical protein
MYQIQPQNAMPQSAIQDMKGKLGTPKRPAASIDKTHINGNPIKDG